MTVEQLEHRRRALFMEFAKVAANVRPSQKGHLAEEIRRVELAVMLGLQAVALLEDIIQEDETYGAIQSGHIEAARKLCGRYRVELPANEGRPGFMF